ncbi:MAG TPA: hypothetical protein VFS40_08020 [Gemmatimonadales bacterium]|nr:hypothetical protein [Gemmatimonadales bacterium]
MSAARESRSERYLRFSQGSLAIALCLVLGLGALGLALVLRPETGARWMGQAGWMLPCAVVIAVGALRRATLRGDRWHPASAEAQAVLQDEWRRASLDRALRWAFVVVLLAQVPLALGLARLPALRAVLAMAVATSVLGLATLLALFLCFARDAERSA